MPTAATRGPGRPPAANASETRDRIVRAAREIFSELGYDAATFQAIASRADLTRPAINHYFQNKQVLYREVVKQTNSMIICEGVAAARRETTLVGRLLAFLTGAMQSHRDDRSAARFMVIAMMESHRHAVLSRDGVDSWQDVRAFVSWAVNDAVERGELPADTDVAVLVEMLVAVMYGMGFYAGFVGTHDELTVILEKFELLMTNKLWRLTG
jgi:AcrR family transcriptional regulator